MSGGDAFALIWQADEGKLQGPNVSSLGFITKDGRAWNNFGVMGSRKPRNDGTAVGW